MKTLEAQVPEILIEEVKKVGGVAVAVATDEQERGVISRWKRDRLVAAGADLVIPDYRGHDRLDHLLFGVGTSSGDRAE